MRASILAGAFAVIALITLAVALTFRSADQERLDDARRANCEAIEQLKSLQRQSIAEDILTSQRFLHENPSGTNGITPELILEGIARDQKQIVNLAPKKC